MKTHRKNKKNKKKLRKTKNIEKLKKKHTLTWKYSLLFYSLTF